MLFKVLLLLNIAAASELVAAQQTRCATADLDMPIRIASPSRTTALEALFTAGEQTGICFGLDIRNWTGLQAEFMIRQQPASIRTLIKAIPDLGWYGVRNGVVVVRLGPGDPDWLDATVSDFEIGPVPIETASAALFREMHIERNPKAGILGDTPYSSGSPRIQPFAMRKASVNTILDRILARSAGGGMWFTSFPHPADQPLPSPFWTVLVYSDPPEANRLKISELTKRPVQP